MPLALLFSISTGHRVPPAVLCSQGRLKLNINLVDQCVWESGNIPMMSVFVGPMNLSYFAAIGQYSGEHTKFLFNSWEEIVIFRRRDISDFSVSVESHIPYREKNISSFPFLHLRLQQHNVPAMCVVGSTSGPGEPHGKTLLRGRI